MGNTDETPRPKSFCGLYRLAVELVRFRATLECCYASTLGWRQDQPVPEGVDTNYGLLALAIEEADADGGDPEALRNLQQAARAMKARFGRHWLDAEHDARLDARAELEAADESNDDARHDWLVLAGELLLPPPTAGQQPGPVAVAAGGGPLGGAAVSSPIDRPRLQPPNAVSRPSADVRPRSPFAPDEWAEYAGAVTRFQESLPDAHRPLVRLVTLLAEVAHPYPSSYDPRTGRLPAFDADDLARLAARDLAEATADVQSGLGLLRGLPPLGSAGPVRPALLRRLDEVRQALADADARRPVTGREPATSFEPDLGGPSYDEETRTLYHRGRVARVFAAQATVNRWLVEFQAGGWKTAVTVGKRASEQVRGLNAGLALIEFHVVPAKRDHIDWREAAPGTGSGSAAG